MNTLYKSPFWKFTKKQSRPFQLAIEDEIERICKYAEIGREKRGDLTGFRVHKFTFRKQEYLIAYKTAGGSVIVYMIDTHENFYKNLKRYVKEVD
jgi:plasmid stabilization system protein ParE